MSSDVISEEATADHTGNSEAGVLSWGEERGLYISY